jgi:alpha-D-xyloside xylohydrolase
MLSCCKTIYAAVTLSTAALLSAGIAMSASAQAVAPHAAASAIHIAQQADGILLTTPTDKLRLTVCGPTVIHVVASPDGKAADATPKQPWMLSAAAACTPAKFTLTMPKSMPSTPISERLWNPVVATLDTGAVRVRISLDFGNLEFTDEQGQRLLEEFEDAPRRYHSVTRNGEALYSVMDQFYPAVREAFYGLGQHQNGMFNYRGAVVELGQANTDVAIPLLVSTNGYGIFWNTSAVSYFDNRFPSEMRLSANAAHAIDYYFVYGPEMDSIVHTYRAMTGHAPLYPAWAYGFWQSKDRYNSQQELLNVAQEYRSQHVPLDAIVQDWFWWVRQGDPEFRADAYPDLPAALRTLHDEHVHAMLSVWAVMNPQAKNFQAMQALGLTIPGTTDYDATNPAAGDYYWKHLVGKLFAQGWDAFWLDSSEPEVQYAHGGQSNISLEDRKLFLGNGALYTNVFPLMHTGNIYRNWRTTWSGDVFSTFTAFQRQIPAGLNFALSGMPYWTTDIAGYGPPLARDTHDPAYQELYTRWFEFGVFCPIFRTHGHRANNTNELFSYGPATPTLIRYDKLRSRLLPYIYSQAWQVTQHDGTIMRPLVMDWRTDRATWNIGDQYMFGPDLLVSPVTQPGRQSRWLYLPPAAAWYDFWTGKRYSGAQHMEAAAPLDRIPLYVKAGSILPLGPVQEYAGQDADAPIEVRIYPGADGQFTLYEDPDDGYSYEQGAHATIPLTWTDATKTLSIGARQGSYPGMTAQREFRVVLVDTNHGVGDGIPADAAGPAGKAVTYTGAAVQVELP